MIYIAGMGPGNEGGITKEAEQAIKDADLLIGAKRLIEGVPAGQSCEKKAAVMPDDIMALIEERPEKDVITILMSGDTGFYSGTRGLLPRIKEAGREVKVIPGISSVQMMSALMGEPWQDWKLVSAHGKEVDAVAELSRVKKTFFLTGGELGPADLAREISDTGLPDLTIWVGSDLSYEKEDLISGKASEIKEIGDLPVLSVLVADKLPGPEVKAYAPGIDDELFVRGDVPMTKRDVRSAVIGRLSIKPGDTVWDVGAGTGSVTVEMAKMAHGGKAFAVETNPEGISLIETNKKRFGCWNIVPVEGMAPDVLSDLPAPDEVFLGGTKGNMDAIIDVITEKNGKARIVVTAIAIETLGKAMDSLKSHGYDVDVTEIQSSYGRKVANLNMLTANNPIFIVTGEKDA